MGAEAAVLRAAGKTVLFAYEVCARTQAILSQVLVYIMLYFVASMLYFVLFVEVNTFTQATLSRYQFVQHAVLCCAWWNG
jgi:hypothetical protein